MVKKLLNISSWDPVLTCPEEDGADAYTVQVRQACCAGWLALAAATVARSQVLENGNITNNIY